MSLFDSIINGVVSVGKIAQTVADVIGEDYYEENGVLVSGGCQSGLLSFHRTVQNNSPSLQASNLSSNYNALLSYPGDINGNGAYVAIVPPGNSIPINSVVGATTPATTPITTSCCSVKTSSEELAGGNEPNFTLSIKNLQVGKNLKVGEFIIKCTTKQLIIIPGIFVASYTLLKSFNLQSNMGAGVSSNTPIAPTTPPIQATVNAQGEYVYDLDFSRYGINTEVSELSGDICMQSTGTGFDIEEYIANAEVPKPRKLLAQEIEYFSRKGLIN